jgi:hypothetical protein
LADFGTLKGDSRPIGQHFEGLAEFHALGLHYPSEDIAADVANPAFERLVFGIYLETGLGVVVPGAEAHVVATLTAQLNMAADKLDNVDSLFNAFLGVERQTA